MRKLSRWMLPQPTQPHSPLGRIVLVLLGAGLLLLLYYQVSARVLLGAFVLLTTALKILDDRRLRRLATARKSESICSFARSFDRRQVDPWIIRAVYEELQPYCRFRGGALPIRASDGLEEDLRIDGEDVSDMVEGVARRTGRSLESTETNPLYGQVYTVGELVLFLTYQPKNRAA